MARLLLVLIAFLVGCDQDPFHRGERVIAGRFRLMQWEDEQTYYLITPDTRNSGGGLIDGTVHRIGWDTSRIVIERHPLVGDSLDWIVIDLHTRNLAGPYAKAQFDELSYVHAIPLVSPDAAWKKLR